MDRTEAIKLLKELVTQDLVDPSYININKRIPNHYQIQIKCNYNSKKIMEFAKKNNLALAEDKEQKYSTIYRP